MSTGILLHTCRIEPKDLQRFLNGYFQQLISIQANSTVFEEYGTEGSLSWFTQRHLTVFNPSNIDSIEQLKPSIPEGIQSSEYIYYEEIYRHSRNNNREIFGTRPFFVVIVELDANNKEFIDWYHTKYLPMTMASIPMWSACRRYRSINRDIENQMTIYEADNEKDLARGFELLRKDYRYTSNERWGEWVGPTILKQDAACFRPIFKYPN